MSKYKNKTSTETTEEANRIAKATQRPAQSKEQTKLIAQGIQKGIEQYKKQNKSKARELDKKLKSASNFNSDTHSNVRPDDGQKMEQITSRKGRATNSLAWILLILSWLGFFIWFQQ